MIIFCALILVIFSNEVSAKEITKNDTLKVPQKNNHVLEIDSLIVALEDQQWSTEQQACLESTVNVLNNVKNFTVWAVWVWDSIQRPVGALYASRYHLGNYDQCLNAPWVTRYPKYKTQYCLADVKLTGKEHRNWDANVEDVYESTESYIRTDKLGRDLTTISWGVCVPAVCDHKSVSKILNAMLRKTHWAHLDNPAISIDSCQTADEAPQYGTGFYGFMAMIVILCSISFSSTLYVNFVTPDSKSKSKAEDSIVSTIVKSCDMKSNLEKIVKRNDDISAIRFSKFLVAYIALTSHLLYYSLKIFGNGLDVEKDIDKVFSPLLAHMDTGIKTFFFMSGLLLMKTLMRKQNLLVFIMKRYVRLIGSLAVMIFYFAAVSPHVADGPLWPSLNGREQQACTKNWWLSLLMMGNFVDTEEICQVTYWYIPADFQLAVLGCLLCYLCKKYQRMKINIFGVALIFSSLVPACITYWNMYPIRLGFDIANWQELRKNIVFQKMYIKSYNHATAYLIGMSMGYFMSIYEPSRYRNTISKKWSVVGYVISNIIILSEWIYGGLYKEYSVMESVLLAGVAGIAWGVGLIGWMAVFEYGHIPILSDIVKCSVFAPMSTLSYGIYLSHSAVIQWKLFSTRTPLRYELSSTFMDSCGVFFASGLVSLLLWTFVEAPLTNICNSLIFSRFENNSSDINDGLKTPTNGVEKNAHIRRMEKNPHVSSMVKNAHVSADFDRVSHPARDAGKSGVVKQKLL